ncbi:hypothetical protein [Mucilaginibacter pocheonensis]|uniref:Uncharacterized protein n=1 Tax=Mucilaginibacter pocheonensis TaxID=398050 RepID=A0ABU1TG42_9SPHI|nr:hypothetical protein [Mucilaginibacter pocheonensis]MDR6944377.1 hypothetical protein [Mucilaginibacter pocheonensis]
MERKTLIPDDLRTISWFNNTIIDWANSGNVYFPNGEVKTLGQYNFALNFNGAIMSSNGKYAFIYQRFGTKGLLLKEGELLREINRSYYYADVYEYPAAFTTVNEITYLIHCPVKYCQLDFENVETGEIITNINTRNPESEDVFHSRLEISPDNTFLISKGWVWHPLDVIRVFNINDCILNPALLDKPGLYPNVSAEICTASFINNTKVLIGSSAETIDDEDLRLPPKHIAVWDLENNHISKPIKVKGDFGNLFTINDDWAWDTLSFPKIINIHTGEIIDKNEIIDSGIQNSSIIQQYDRLPQIIFNRHTKQLAIAHQGKIEILTP